MVIAVSYCFVFVFLFFFFKKKTAYEMRISDWSSDVCSSDLPDAPEQESIDARLTGTDGRNRRYAVVAVRDGDDTRWLDPAGFELAVSKAQTPSGSRLFRSDFELRTAGNRAGVVRVFRPA